MPREQSVETERAEETKAGLQAADDANHGFGRSRSLNSDEKQRLAREQGAAIASGRARKGHIVLNTPVRRAIFIGGLLGLVMLALVVAIFR